MKNQAKVCEETLWMIALARYNCLKFSEAINLIIFTRQALLRPMGLTEVFLTSVDFTDYFNKNKSKIDVKQAAKYLQSYLQKNLQNLPFSKQSQVS